MLLPELFEGVTQGWITLWAKRGAQKRTIWFDLGDPGTGKGMETWAAQLDGQMWDVYFSTCPAMARGSAAGRISQRDVSKVPALFMDVDTLADESKAGVSVVRRRPKGAGRLDSAAVLVDGLTLKPAG